MPGIIDEIARAADEIASWRRDLHAHPETAFEENRTSDMVAKKLQSFGIEVHRGLGKTGVVGVLANGAGKSIGLRADMDALHIEEHTNLAYASTHAGRMHACGHDGHTAMLLGAAKYLAASRRFFGTVVLIFQPAEENEGGGRVMVEDGLFRKFPVDGVYGMHNWPGMPVGTFAMHAGPMMAAFDTFETILSGKGTHAGMPHMGRDPVVAAAQLVSAWQTIPARNIHPADAAVVSVTQIHAGDTWNVIPEEVTIRGTVRSFREPVRALVHQRMGEAVQGISTAFGVDAKFDIHPRYPATINTAVETDHAAKAATDIVGAANVDRTPVPSMGAEDFSFMLRERPGCYVWIGNGPADNGRCLHSPHYDFNDAALPVGASYWVRLVENFLAR